jgi:hypothetical protein
VRTLIRAAVADAVTFSATQLPADDGVAA